MVERLRFDEISPGIEPKPLQTESSRSLFQVQNQVSTHSLSAYGGLDVKASDLSQTRLNDRECYTPVDGRNIAVRHGNEEDPSGGADRG